VKYILTILFLLTAYFVNAQYIPNSAAYQYKGLKQTNSLQPPTGTAFPVTATNAPDSNYAAWYYNTLDTSFYQFNPIPKTWTKLQASGGLQIDSVFITSIDSIFINNNDSIFIITNNNDTIFIGTGNPAVDTIYQRGPDSIFAVKSGVEFLAAVTGSSAPSGGMDTAYSRQDSIFGVKNNGEFLIATSQQTIDSIFITATDSIFIISGNDTIFIGTNNGGGASLQSAYDSSIRAGDNPTINAHGNSLTIDSAYFTVTSSPNPANANAIGFIHTDSAESAIGSNNDTLNASVSTHFLDGDIEADLGAARHDAAQSDASHIIRVHPGYVKIDAGASRNAKIIAKVDTLITPPTMVYVPDHDTLKVYPFSGGGASGAMDTAYQRGDSLFGVKNGVEFLVGLVGGAPGPVGTKDTLWYNVKWFGALGDGVTDDRAAIQLADDYLSVIKGGYMWFPAGVYPVSSAIYRHSYVNWEGVKDSSIVKNKNPTHTTFGDQSVMWMGNYNPSAYDTTVGRFFRGHMGTVGNKMAIVDSISRFNVGDVVLIEGMTGWTSNDGHWKPYVVRFNEIDSIYSDTIVFHYQVDTILTNARINISGHFIDPNDGIDGNGHVKYMVRNVTTRNMVFESEGQWILGMTSLGCSWENIRIRAAELFTGNGMAWTTARNIYGQWWRQVSEFAIGCHNTIITGVNAHYINRADPDAKPYIKFGENVHAITIKDLFIDAGNFNGNGVWFGAATECVVDGIHSTSQNLRQTHIEFSDNDLGDAPASYVNNNILRHGYFKNYNSLNNYILMDKSVSAGQLRNNVVSDVTFVGPVNDGTALVIDGYRTEFRDLYTTEGEIVGGDSLYKGIISGGSIANNYDIHGNDSNVFIRSVFDTAGKNRSHFTDIILKYVPDNTTTDGQLWYNQGLDELNFNHNGTTTDLLAAGSSTPIQTLTNGYGILGNPFNGISPETWQLDTSVLNGQIFLDSNNIQYFVDTIAASPAGFLTGAKVLVAHTGTSGVFVGHEDDIATLTGAVWSFIDAVSGNNLVVSNETQPTAFYKFDGTVWRLQRRSVSIGGDRINGNIDIGTLDNQNFRFFTNGFLRERISSGGQHYFRRYVGARSNNYLKIVDTATGRMDTASFTQLVLTTTGSSGASTLSNDTLNIPVYSGGAGSTNSNIGSGYRLAVPGTNNIKTLHAGTNITMDSVSNANEITINSSAGGGGTTTNALTMNNGGAGDASGTTFNGSAARTLSYNTIGAQAALSGTGYVSFSGTTPSYIPTITPTTGGTGLTSYTTGDLLYASATNTLSKLAIGTLGQPLTVSGSGIPAWGTYISQDSVIINAPNLLTTLSPRLILRNPTTTTTGLTQYSPRMYFEGHGFFSAADHVQAVSIGIDPATAVSILPSLVFRSYMDGAVQADSMVYRNGTLATTGQMSATRFVGSVTSGTFQAATTSIVSSATGSAVSITGGQTANTQVDLATGSASKNAGTGIQVQIATPIAATSTAATTMFKINPQITSIGSGAFLIADFQYNNTALWSLDKDGTVTQTRPTKSSGSTPSNTPGTGAGTGPTVSVTGNDIAGYVSIATGTTPTAAANIVTVTFATQLAGTPKAIQLTPANANAAIELTKVYVDQANTTSTAFIIKNSGTALTASTTYLFYYTVTQ